MVDFDALRSARLSGAVTKPSAGRRPSGAPGPVVPPSSARATASAQLAGGGGRAGGDGGEDPRGSPQVQALRGRSRDWLDHVPPAVARGGAPLRAIFVGHNPSAASWDMCMPYAHRSNLFWRLLHEAALVGEDDGPLPAAFARLAATRGIAFADIIVASGSDASKVRPKPGAKPVHEDLVERMAASLVKPPRALVLVSKTVAEQFLRRKTAHFGMVGTSADFDLPGWLGDSTQIWVLPSTSARAPIPTETRLAPFRKFATAIEEWPWESMSDSMALRQTR